MSAPAISCEVFVDGARLADTGDAWQAGTPTALSGLSTKWGRDGPQDQPDAATCSLTVADKDGDTEFLSVLYVGALLDVYAAALIDAGGPTDVAADGGFGSPIGMRVKADKGTVADDPASDAIAPPGHACKFTLTPDLTAAGWLTVPPAPFTTHPGGWLTVPQISPGEAWTMSIRVKVGPVPPPQLAIQIVGFRDSLSQWGDQLANGPTIAGAAGQYVTVTVPWTVDAYIKPGTYWLGLAVNNITPAKYNQAPAGLTYAATPPGSYGDCRCLWVDDFHLMAPAVTQRRGHVFTGRITDLTATAMAGQAVAVDVIAVDWIADLANQNIGDAPWLAERLDARAARILNKTNVGTGALPVAYIDARCARMLVSWQDVDNQPIYGLMEDLAVSGDGILWPIGYRVLWVEDPETRGSTGTFGPDPGGSGLITVTASRPTGGVVLDSCDVLQDGLELGQTAGDVINRVSLTWLDQTLDEAGKPAPTDITIYVDDTSAGADALGVRELSVSTILANGTDAGNVANLKLQRSRALAWHASGLSWDIGTDPDAAATATALQLLDMSARAGMLLTVMNTPAWIPLGPDWSSWLESGAYRYDAGRWRLELGVTPSTASGASCKYRDCDPAWQYKQVDSAIAYVDLWGTDSSYTKGAPG